MSGASPSLPGFQWADCPIRVIDPVFFDIETTGLRPNRGARITEMAVVDRREVRYHWRRGASTSSLASALPRLFGHLREAVVVGHNLQFDFGFVAYEAERYGLDGPDLRYVDTLGLARRLVRGVPDYQLATLLRACALPVPVGLHTAVADAWATRALFWRLVEEGGLETLADAGMKRLHWGTF